MQFRLSTLLLAFVVVAMSLAVFGAWGAVVGPCLVAAVGYLRGVQTLAAIKAKGCCGPVWEVAYLRGVQAPAAAIGGFGAIVVGLLSVLAMENHEAHDARRSRQQSQASERGVRFLRVGASRVPQREGDLVRQQI